MGWSFDIAAAPRGSYSLRAATNGKGHIRTFEPARVFLATKCGQVTVSNYLPDFKRWEMLATNEQPIAWMPSTEPKTVVDENGRTRLVWDLPAYPVAV